MSFCGKTSPLFFATDSGEQVVMLSLEDFNSWQETIYLLSNPANATHLQKSIEQVRRGGVTEKELIDA
jgi:antitoxin YefM